MKELGLRGAMIDPNALGRPLGDRAFDPFWEAAAELGVPVILHPFLARSRGALRAPLSPQPGRVSVRDDAGGGQPHPRRHARSIPDARRRAGAWRRLPAVSRRALRSRARDTPGGSRRRGGAAERIPAPIPLRYARAVPASARLSGEGGRCGSRAARQRPPFWLGDPAPTRIVRETRDCRRCPGRDPRRQCCAPVPSLDRLRERGRRRPDDTRGRDARCCARRIIVCSPGAASTRRTSGCRAWSMRRCCVRPTRTRGSARSARKRRFALPGVLAVVTGEDLGAIGRIPVRLGPRPSVVACLQPPLAREKVRYVGEPVAS